jgi:hypothetical protein
LIDDQHQNPPWKYGYFFAPYANTNANEVFKQVCIWLDYPVNYYNYLRQVPVPKPGHPNHVPIAVPTGGNYNNWIVIRGIYTDRNAWLPPTQLVVKGFWLNDPKSGGLGTNTYVTAQYFNQTYFQRLTVPGDLYNGQYLAITDPPRNIATPKTTNIKVIIAETPAGFTTAEAQLVAQRKSSDKTGTINSIVTKTAFNVAWDVLKNDQIYANSFALAKPIETPQYNGNTCSVTFSYQGTIFTVTLLTITGSLAQISIKGLVGQQIQ